MVSKETYELQIAGVTFKLKTSHDPATVNELVHSVDSRIQQAMTHLKSGSFQNATILAALNIAEELLLLKRRTDKELEKLEEKVSRLSTDIEASAVSRQNLDV